MANVTEASAGTLAEAIEKAVSEASAGYSGADRLVEWKLVEVSGKSGGIAGIKEVTAKIEHTA